jgi:N-acetylmuramoyl-L-alanine amidase
VVVDAGHGGLEPGAVRGKSREKDLNLAVALLVGKMITDSLPSVEVIYTRKTDISVPLHERSNIANKHNADLFISIHSNSARNTAAKGSETFVMGIAQSAENMEVAKRENAVITYEDDYTSKYEGYDPNSPESFIIFSLMQHAYLDQSLQLAALVQEELGTYPIKVNRGVKQAGFLVLWRTAMPSILVEMGFISNPEEEKILASKDGQARIAKSIFNAFKNYKSYYDRLAELTNNAVAVQKIEAEKIALAAEPKKDSDTTYRVQIKASKTKVPLNAAAFKPFNDVMVIHSNNLYKYTAGNFAGLEEAQKYCNEVVRKKIKDAFVICVENEKIVPLKK